MKNPAKAGFFMHRSFPGYDYSQMIFDLDAYQPSIRSA